MSATGERHSLDLACGISLLLVSAIDFYTARSLSLVAYVEPRFVSLVRVVDTGLSIVCAIGVGAVLMSLPVLLRETHRRLTFVVLTFQTVGLTLDVVGLIASTIFGEQSNPIYLLLEVALVHTSTVLLFTVWYVTMDHPRQVAHARGGGDRQCFSFPQHSVRYPGYEGWVPGYVDYLSLAFTTSSSLGAAEAVPLAIPVKLLVILQVSISLVIIIVLAARAIGLIA